jgi:hypothetical protein
MIAQQARQVWQQVNWTFVRSILTDTFYDAWWATICVGALWSLMWLGWRLEPGIFEWLDTGILDAWGRNTQVTDHLAMASLPAVVGYINGFWRKEKDDV